jgi:hypothetical protein
MKTLLMVTAAIALAVLLASPVGVQAQAPGNIVLAAIKAPVVADGDVAGRPTEFVLVLDRSLDPYVEGRSLRRGRTIKVTLPEAFIRTDVPVKAPDSGILTKGWPQGAITTYDLALAGTHTLIYTATQDILPEGPDSPGLKLVHIRGRAFTNPAPGQYPIGLEAESGPSGAIERGSGLLTIRPAVVPSIGASNALFRQPSNNNWQRVAVNTVTAIPLDFLLFDADGKPMDGVGVAPADLGRFPRYTGGLLAQDGKAVGGIIGSAPPGASGQRAFSPSDAAGRPILSGQLTLPNGDPAHGILRVLFRAGDQPGNYTPTFELEGGTSVQMTIVAVPSPAGVGPVMPSGLPRTGVELPLLATILLGGGLTAVGAAFRRIRTR